MKKAGVIAAVVVAVICVLGGLGFFGLKEYQKQQRTEEENARQEKELRPLRMEKYDLRDQLQELEKNYNLKLQGVGTASMLFTRPDVRVYTEVWPVMKEYGFTGVVAVSGTGMPGMEGCMSIEQLKELQGAGWEVCISWSGEESFDDWYGSVAGQLMQAGIAYTPVMYFPAGSYSAACEEVIAPAGFSIAIHHGEAGEIIVDADSEGVWHPGAVGLQGNAPKTQLESAVQKKGNIIYTIGYELPDEMYNEQMFRSMLKYFQSYHANKGFQVMGVTGAREYRSQLATGMEGLKAEYEQQKAELEARIEKLEQKIQEIEDGSTLTD